MDGLFTVRKKDSYQTVDFTVQINNGVMDKNTIEFMKRGVRETIFMSKID
jgi:hypothetical protein